MVEKKEDLLTALVEVQRRLTTLERVTDQTPGAGALPHQLLAAVETMQLGVTVADPSGVIIYANPAQARMYGAESPDELIGQDVSIFCLPGYREPLTPKRLDEMTSWRRESVNRCKDGSLLPVLLLSDVVLGADGRPTGVVTTSQDLSDVKRAETERNHLELQVQHSQSLEHLGVLTSGVSRDLRDTLAIIVDNTGLFLENLPLDPEKVRGRIVDTDAAIHRLSVLTDQLLAYSGQGLQGKLRLNLTSHLRGMLPLFEASAAPSVSFRYELPEHVPSIQADPTQVHHVVRQLIANASEAFQGQPGEIRIRVQARHLEIADLDECHVRGGQGPGDYVMVEVSDDGPGMDADTVDRIFEPFFSRRSSSRGLGLAAAAAILLGHDGAIRVDSLEGEGTDFRLFFPVAAGAETSEVEGVEAVVQIESAETVVPEAVRPGVPERDVLPSMQVNPGLWGGRPRPRCPRCGQDTQRVGTSWYFRPVRLLLPRHSSTRACGACSWTGFRLHRWH